MSSNKKTKEAIKINKTFVEKQDEPGEWKDSELRGFGLKVTPKGKKVYFVETNIKGRKTPTTVTIGKHGEIGAKEARDQARETLGLMRRGINPNLLVKEKAKKNAEDQAQLEVDRKRKELTLKVVFADYLAARNLKASTEKVYGYVVNSEFSPWLNKPLLDITKDMVEKRHREISLKHKGEADHAMRILRALFEFAKVKYEDSLGRSIFVDNPVKRLSQVRAWNKLPRRQTVITPAELKKWLSTVQAYEHKTTSDYLQLLLFTGLRKEEAATLTWEDIDLDNQTIRVRDTKNREEHMLPMSDFLLALLKRRWKDRESSLFVFPNRTDDRHIVDIRYHIYEVADRSGIRFTVHDLRRTFATIATETVTQYELKKLMNHKDGSDVTYGYIHTTVRELREPMQRVTNVILGYAGFKKEPEHKSKGDQ